MAKTLNRWGLVRTWLALGLGVLLLAAVIGLSGGFAEAPPRGNSAAPGEPVDLARWSLRADRAEYVNQALGGYETDPAIRLWLRVTFTGPESLCCLPSDLVTLRIGDASGDGGRFVIGGPRTSQFDPDVEVQVPLEFSWPVDSSIPVAAPATVSVIAKDEKRGDSLVFGETWEVSGVVAVIELDCPDRRQDG